MDFIKSVVVWDNVEVSYVIKKSRRARRLRITIRPDKNVIVTIPFRLPKEVGEQFLVRQKKWVCGKLQEISKIKIDSAPSRPYEQYKARAKKLILERVRFYNATYQFKFNRVSIKQHKTRWGSCSAKKNLNFNYKLFFLPGPLIDYVVVHEICHLKELNHSAKFWALVGKTINNYAVLRRELNTQPQ